jgi:CRISPR/Cas system endoribonuclease Cas6 (RAMP superfamily)
MRVIIKLEDEKKQAIDNTYNKLQGFVYSLIREKFGSIHDKKGYKFFCFSNIFPFEVSGIRNFIISSPSKELINSIAENLVLFELGAEYYWREKDKGIDFLKNSLAVEVKLKTKISKEDTRSIESFLKNMERNIRKLISLQKTQKEKWTTFIYFHYGNFVSRGCKLKPFPNIYKHHLYISP